MENQSANGNSSSARAGGKGKNAYETLRILIVAANPLNRNQLALDKEFRALREMMFPNMEADACELRIEWAARAEDLQRALVETKPHILHFCGHGSDDCICLEDGEGNNRPLSKTELGLLLHPVRDCLRVVVLNACYGVREPEALSQFVDFVIGSKVPVADTAALHFTNQFYRGVATGGTVREAFSKAQQAANNFNQYELVIRPGADENTPLLPPILTRRVGIKVSEGIKADEVNLAGTISDGTTTHSGDGPVPHTRESVDLETSRVEAKIFNFAGLIAKRK